MNRREIIAGLGSAVAWAVVARAQQGKPVVGYLSAGSEATEAPALIAFRQGLNQGTYVEGRNVEILFRYADNQLDHLGSLAFDLVGRRVSVIIASSGAAAVAAQAATSTTPIVFMGATDPVAAGLVASLNRPGGNITAQTGSARPFFPKELSCCMRCCLKPVRLRAWQCRPVTMRSRNHFRKPSFGR